METPTQKRKLMTPEREAHVVTLSRYFHQRDIARMLEFAPATICKVQRKYHLVLPYGRRPARRVHTIRQEREVISLSRYHCQREIAEMLDLNKSTVHNIQRKYHLVLAFGQSKSSSQFRHKWDQRLWHRVLTELYINQEMPLPEVARRCKIATRTVAERMKVLGLPIRDRGTAQRLRAKRLAERKAA